uniref:Tfp pilus assembly protein PilF n=1 Tax=Candidatus Kentrum sp. UNK TaxID=2126344 RepID=A0A451AX27_9GAMM|nr:MAG: Tfp pilus assembly protein PilF [Candidatus Kentron sp. UNK]VFK70611.1 MAG: Tfp pilus assembly protein PilF [Candidatus Kentron sp. UNK]
MIIYPRLLALALLIGLGVVDVAMAQDGPVSSNASATIQATSNPLIPMPVPNLERLENAVKEHLRAARADLVSLQADPKTTQAVLGDAYGRLGQIYHAHRLDASAEACYRNAEHLLPKDLRWPYLLGYLYQQRVQLSAAVRSYRRALALDADDTPTQLRLAQVLLALDRIDEATPFLDRVSKAPGFQGVADFELGKAALRQGRHAEAVERLTRAYAAHPEASGIHYPLAMAYRGLGELEAARRHLQQRGEVVPPIPDPLVEELSELLSGKRTRQYHAMKAVWRGEFEVAAKEYRAILALDPADIGARVSLGRCLYLLDDPDGAARAFGAVLERKPKHDKANYFLGRLLWEKGQKAAAATHFQTTLETDPRHGGAHFFVAKSLMQQGNFQRAADHFRKVSEILPEDLESRQREAAALVAAGASMHQTARQRIVDALEIHPDDLVLTGQLARLLAGSPDPDARDGRRALTLAKELFARHNTIENAQLVAMAHAEIAHAQRVDFDAAVAYQQAALDTAFQYYGPYEIRLLERLKTNLDAYLARQPYRIPDGEALHDPR